MRFSPQDRRIAEPSRISGPFEAIHRNNDQRSILNIGNKFEKIQVQLNISWRVANLYV